MKKRLIALACWLASTASAQIGGDYLGPAVLTSGATGIGNRSGPQVDLRFFAGVDGVYDSSVQPVAIDPKGNLVTLKGLVGVEASLGVYGNHAWQRSTLGIDYRGTFRAYTGAASSDRIDQSLHLGYTWQESKRVILNSSLSASIYSNSLGGIATTPLSIRKLHLQAHRISGHGRIDV